MKDISQSSTLNHRTSVTPAETAAANLLIELAFAEDLGDPPDDVTSRVMIGEGQAGSVDIVARKDGVLAGLPIVGLAFERLGSRVKVDAKVQDGSPLRPGTVIATLSGPLRTLLTGERTALNFLTHLSGIASVTRRYVEAVRGTNAVILDTRKTHPAYRRLEKYAVRMGGGQNHRMGLFDGCLIKDNHIAAWFAAHGTTTLADAIRHARRQIGASVVEVEVDSLEQLADALDADPDIVLLDNMSPETLRKAVALRKERGHAAQLEASGGVNLETVAKIAATGVDRISVGGLTHSAMALDIAFDWHEVR
ncbi:MAG: carboxylating nicotinate-nucleotide diphosphorylase [Planctomycetaceae bacterium]|nr:carboxylating nicotinate-nucleotide diphosphorylase [Planctomycetaceae bacterium]